MNKKVYYIYGTETGEGIIEALIKKGGKIGNERLTGRCPDGAYYINQEGYIKCTIDANMISLLKMVGTELSAHINRQNPGQTYFYVEILNGSVNIQSRFDMERKLDDRLYELGNYFRTIEEAETYVNTITLLFKRRNTNE